MVAQSDPYDLVIVGGGAAGYFAASNVESRQRILILEKARQPLGKVLISGGGRCNVTHACFDPWQLTSYYPRGADELKGAFTRFQPWDTLSWFEGRGVKLKIEQDGRVFPASDDARSIVDCLMTSAETNGAELWRQSEAIQIRLAHPETGARYSIHVLKRQDFTDTVVLTRNILLATGGSPHGFQLAASLGHTIIPPVPSLFTFQVKDQRLDGLAGLSFPHVRIRLLPLQGETGYFAHEGPLLITHQGVSGPVVLSCSAWGARWLNEQNYHVRLEINWLHPSSLEHTLSVLHRYKALPENRRRTVLAHSPFSELPRRLWEKLVLAADVREADQWSNQSKKSLLKLAQELSTGRYEITGKNTHKDEFVTCGGVHLSEVDFKTMQSRLAPGVYFAGEILNIDGLTGGFNFQNAWTTAYLASKSLSKASQTSDR